MNVVLIGYRGTGKSTVAKSLAVHLRLAMISTDAEIVSRAGHAIADIVAKRGWDYFRDLESQTCQELADRDGLVIDTGGGAILRGQNVAALKKNGKLFWLTASVATIAERIGGERGRPSLTGTKSFIEEIQEVLSERTPRYQEAADFVIATDGRSVRQVVDEIVVCLQLS
jgi:shikimate kinase